MGANYNFTVLKATTPAKAKKEALDLIEDCKYEFGHGGYSGTFAECTGVEMSDKKFQTLKEADAWLDENAQKWGPLVVVKAGKQYCAGAVCSD